MKIIAVRVDHASHHNHDNPLGQPRYRAVVIVQDRGIQYAGVAVHATSDAAVYGAFEDAARQPVDALRATLEVNTMVEF